MQTLSHKYIALVISGVSATLMCIAILIGMFFISNFEVTYIVLAGLSLFVILYVILFYMLRTYIIQKVKPIYKIIHSSQQNPLKKAKLVVEDDFNILATTEKDVMEWVKQNAFRIEELQRLEKYRKEYIGNVSHELKTPIFSVQGYISTLLDGGIDDPAINIKYLERADTAIQRMAVIVRDLDAITRLESGELVPEKAHFDVILLVKEIFEAQELLAQSRNIKLILEAIHDKPLFVLADRKYIHMVLSNLIVNAIKYNKLEGGEVSIRFYDMDKLLLVEVADTGIGIQNNDLNRIFERFYRVDKSRSREQGGTGLGLSIVKHIIEAHEQTIHVKSTVNKGSSFTFTLEKSNN